MGIDRTTYVRKELGLIPITTDEWVKIADSVNEDPCFFFCLAGAPVDYSPLTPKEETLMALYRSLRQGEREDFLVLLSVSLKHIKRKKVREALEKLCGKSSL